MAEPVTTIADFLALTRKSGLIEGGRLDEACAEWPDRSQPLPDEFVAKLVDSELLTPWQAGQLRKGKHGFFLGNYKLLKLLGAGGMGSVYLAEHVNLQDRRAIKVLPKSSVDKTSYLSRFWREARAIFRLPHPNIVQVYDLDASGDVNYFVMEYVEGIDLHQKVKELAAQKALMPVRDAADYIRQAAVGLQHAHERGVIHRDIKPANLILDKEGVIKILDFGLALAATRNEDASLTVEFNEKVLGTADYLAPEQARDSHKADARSDIYALGCTLYYLLAGKVLFPEGGIKERLLAHQGHERPNLLDVRPDVPGPIVELYSRMVQDVPDARPQTAKEVAELLGGWLNSATGAAPPKRLRTAATVGTGGRSGAGPAVLTGPGSGISTRTPASGIGTGAPVFAPTAGSAGAGRAAPKLATPVKTAPAKAPAATKAASESGGGEATSGQRMPRSLLGLPLGLWIAAAAGVLLAIGLGVSVIMRQPSPRDSSAGATAAPEIAGKQPVKKPAPPKTSAKKPAAATAADTGPSPLDLLPTNAKKPDAKPKKK